MTTEIQPEGETDYAFAEAIPDIFFAAGADGRAVYFNRRWYDYTGIAPREGPAQDWTSRLHPEDLGRCRDAWRESLRGGAALNVECRLRAGDGGHRWFLGRAAPRLGPSGAIRSWFATCTDVDALKRSEEALRLADERFRVIARAVPQVVWEADPLGRAAFFNDRWFEYTGMSPEASLGWGWIEAVHPDDRDRVLEAWRAAVESRSPAEVEQRVRRGEDGAYRRHVVRGVPILDDRGAVVQWVGCTIDEEDRLARDETLEHLVRERTAELLRSNQDLEKFALVASHDLQEPLRKILAFGDRLAAKSGPALDAPGRDYLDRIMGAATRMQALIRDLMAYSRAAGRARAFEEVDLRRVAEEVLADLEVAVQREDARVELGPLPNIHADRAQMRQLLHNLIGNAIKFRRPERGSVVRVSARSARDDAGSEGWELEVADDGIGFDEAHAERIFQLFQRLHGRSRYEGAGMGLAICRRIVERHAGTITASGSPGEGATFRVWIPARPPLGGAAEGPAPENAQEDPGD